MKPRARLLILSPILLFLTCTLAFGKNSQPPDLTCQINRISRSARSVEITCSIKNLLPGKTALQFVDQFAGIDRLSERVHSLRVTAEQGTTLPLEIRGDGLYLFDADHRSNPVTVNYEMRLARALDPSQYALVSSFGADAAVLMMADLLPRVCFGEQGCETAIGVKRMKIAIPEDWQMATTEQRDGEWFKLADDSRAVFFLGKLKTRTAKIGDMNLLVAIAGDRGFSDEEVYRLTEAIVREQASIIGGKENGDFLLAVAPFPQPLTGLRSSAVTIGRTVTFLFNPNNDADQSLKHFRRHLAHELFHFYLPNAFRIRENFDWFWEGFTRYVALMTLAGMGLIESREYLDSISEEYEAYLFNPSRLQISLVAASPDKFASAANYDLVYRKGMLVAALYDLELRKQSRGKFNLTEVMKILYADFAVNNREVGNREVLDAMGKLGNFSRLIQDDIMGTREINLAERTKGYGLTIEQSNATRGRARLRFASKLSGWQREMFSKLMNGQNSIR